MAETTRSPDAKAAGASIFTIPPGAPFLRTLATAMLSGDLPRPGGTPLSVLDLPRITVYLPTRRAARALQDAFLEVCGEKALLLPRIRPIAEGNEDLALLASYGAPEALAAAGAEIAPAIGEIERRLVLTRLVLQWSAAMRGEDEDGIALVPSAGAETAAQAAGLALELSRLMDEAETEGVSLAGLASLVPESLSEHWQRTLQFLDIVLSWWPDHLAERRLLSPTARRNRLIEEEARRLILEPPDAPVIIAGVTGSIPATIGLMRAVAALPEGAIVLPGLDQHLDEASWQAISPAHPEHPQHGMRRLLAALGCERSAVAEIRPTLGPSAIARNGLLGEAMRPASTTARWHAFAAGAAPEQLGKALAGVSLIEAASAEDEAEAVSLILREALETPGQTAALVTRDRLLARRVAIRLESWGIRVDDSAGRPLAKTMPGTLLDLVIGAVASRFEPSRLMSLLKHPLVRLGLPAGAIRRAARALEIAAFRTIYIGRGLDGIEAALARAELDVAAGERRERAVSGLRQQDWKAARDLLARLRKACRPLDELLAREGRHGLRDLARAHAAAAEALAALPDDDSAPALWEGEAGAAAALFLAGLLDEDLPALPIAAADYPDLYRSLVAQEVVRPRVPPHPRLSIWGPLEARLQQPDIVVIGALNEGAWPEVADPGPWLNRPMRQALGLPAPEERIGYAAHDFTMLMGASRVYLTRAQKVDGAPAVPSRWLLRLQALLAGLGLSTALEPDRPWLRWAMDRHQASVRRTIRAPEPRPPVGLRPRRLSVSAVETWIANPYAIFARAILKLEPMPMLAGEPDAALRGSVIHGALSGFARRHPLALPANAEAELVALAREMLKRYGDSARVQAFWLPRLERFAAWFAETEPERRKDVLRSLAEVPGELVLGGPAGPFKLTTRADRIDVRADGLVITDYKSGASLSALRASAERGEAPQLALEALIAEAGGLTGLGAAKVTGLRYISASGGEPPGAEVPLKSADISALARASGEGLERLIAEFDRPDTPYRAVRRARFAYDYDDYAHLARVAEWSAAGIGEGE